MSLGPGHAGYEARTRSAERRDFFDLRRRLVGGDEVFIGPSDPGDEFELWYDTDADSTAWLAGLTILTGWAQSSQIPGNVIQYRKVGDNVTVRGRLTNTTGGALTNTSPAFNLPAGYRPLGALVIQLGRAVVPVIFDQWAVETGGNLRPASGYSVPAGAVVVFDMGFTFAVT